jgi:hypothetical protein
MSDPSATIRFVAAPGSSPKMMWNNEMGSSLSSFSSGVPGLITS